MKTSREMSRIHCQRVGERETLCQQFFFLFRSSYTKTLLFSFFLSKNPRKERALERETERHSIVISIFDIKRAIQKQYFI